MIEESLSKSIERRYFPARPFDVSVNVLSNDLARAELHWTPSTSMREGIMCTAEWMKGELAKAAC